MTKSKPLYTLAVVERKCGLEGCPGDAKIKANVQASINQHREIGHTPGVTRVVNSIAVVH